MTIKTPVLHVVGICSYREGDRGEIRFAAENESDLPNLNVPKTGIVGDYEFRVIREPSARILTLANDGAEFSRTNSGECGAFFGSKPTGAAWNYETGWTWTREEREYLDALIMWQDEQANVAK